MELHQTLNGGYAGLYGEVVDYDIYHLRDVADIVSINDPSYVHVPGHTGINFTPDVVFDLGANIGIFSRYVRSLWPAARIVAVEPHPDNCKLYKMFTVFDDNTTLIEKAIGKDELWHFEGAVNGSGESYSSPGIGYPKAKMGTTGAKKSTVGMVMPDELINFHVKEGQKFLVKMDIEGAENCVFAHEPSMQALRRADYFCMEIHFYAMVHTEGLTEELMKILTSFEATHNCRLDNDSKTFYARKR